MRIPIASPNGYRHVARGCMPSRLVCLALVCVLLPSFLARRPLNAADAKPAGKDSTRTHTTIIGSHLVRVKYGRGLELHVATIDQKHGIGAWRRLGKVVKDDSRRVLPFRLLGTKLPDLVNAEIRSAKVAPFMRYGCVVGFTLGPTAGAPPKCYWATHSDVRHPERPWGLGPIPLEGSTLRENARVISVQSELVGDSIDVLVGLGSPQKGMQFIYYCLSSAGLSEPEPAGSTLVLIANESRDGKESMD